MNESLQELIDKTRKALGLNHHTLKRQNIFREINAWCETVYLLNMEWFPDDAVKTDDDLNPPGTASVEVDLFTQEIRRITFVEGINTADLSLYPKLENSEAIIKWVETFTGLTYGQHFILENSHNQGQSLRFIAAAEHTPVSPGGSITVELNDNGVLNVFDINGVFPRDEQIASEPFTLTSPQYEAAAQTACKLMTLPDQTQEAWVPVYAIEEFYLTNDGQTMPYDPMNRCSLIEKDRILTWDTPLGGTFTKQAVNVPHEVSLETALAHKAHPEASPLTDAEVAACESEVLRFMRLVYPDDSGKWRLTHIYLDNGLIIAALTPAKSVQNMLHPKIKLLITRDTLKVMNYIDQTKLYDEMFKSFAEYGQPEISQAEAFSKLRMHLQARPVYVQNTSKDPCIKCAKVDCDYGVNAVTGELMNLTDV